MKYVQIAILAALVLVAGLLGLNLIRDSNSAESTAAPIVATDAADAPAQLAEPPALPATETTPNAAVPPKPVPVAQPQQERQAKAPVVQRKAPVNAASSRPSPSATPASKPAVSTTGVASAPPPPSPAENIRVDPPQPSTQSLPDPPVETASARQDQDRYELMRPERQAATLADPPAKAVEPARTVTIPAGTILTVRTAQTLSSETAGQGDTFAATLDQPLVFEDLVIAERGSRAEGRVMEVDEGGRVKGVATISVQLTKISTSDGQLVPIQTQTFILDAPKSVKGDAAKVGIATGIGAALGAIFGGGKGAAIGAAAGAGAGTGTVLATKGKAAEIPAETRVNFRLDQPLHLTEQINQ